MSSVFSIALSSLQAESDAIDITGNNLANMNTDGFKGSDVDFKDLFSESYGFGGFNTGLGVFAPVNNQLFTQGGVQTTTAPLAAAIQGNGFFVVQSQAGAQLYTRDGNFTQNADGVLQTQTGENVQGWTASGNGTIDTSGPASSIVLPTGTTLPPTATQNFSLTANLDAAGVAGMSTGTFTAPMQVVDSLGNTHNLTVTFTQSATASNTWSYAVTLPVGDLDSTQTGTAAEVPSTVASGSLTFDTNGNLVNPNAPADPSPVAIDLTGTGTNGRLADGAASMSMNWDLFNSTGTGLITNYSQTSGLASSTQDGTQASQMSSLGVQNGGQVVAVYSNGQQKVVGQLAVAGIQNPDSLLNVGNNNFAISTLTSTPAIGVPQSGGRGQVLGGSVESSNVDMAQQFTNLIVYQSAYQASSRVISTANTMTQDLMQLIH